MCGEPSGGSYVSPPRSVAEGRGAVAHTVVTLHHAHQKSILEESSSLDLGSAHIVRSTETNGRARGEPVTRPRTESRFARPPPTPFTTLWRPRHRGVPWGEEPQNRRLTRRRWRCSTFSCDRFLAMRCTLAVARPATRCGFVVASRRGERVAHTSCAPRSWSLSGQDSSGER